MSRKSSVLATLSTSPAQEFAQAVEHTKRLLTERLKSRHQVVCVLEIDGPLFLFADDGPAAACLHDELHRRLSALADKVLAIGAFRFLVISRTADMEDARAIARRAMEAVSAPTEIGGVSAVVVGVAGAAFLPAGSSASAALQQSAVALNEARRRGRRLLMSHDLPTLTYAGPAALADEVEQLERALRQDRFRLALQPVIDARTRTTLHHEALLRVRGEDGAMGSAAALIAAAERLETSTRLDLAVLDLAVGELAARPGLQLAVNVSAASARDPSQARRWLDRLGAIGEDISRVTVELTETAAPDDATGALSRFAAEVRELGASFSLDDFGSGYTSCSNLLALQPHEVKIDGAIVQAMRSDVRSRALVRGLVGMARELGIRTVAEWVETEAEAEFLTGLGVDALQGFYFGLPEVGPDTGERLIA